MRYISQILFTVIATIGIVACSDEIVVNNTPDKPAVTGDKIPVRLSVDMPDGLMAQTRAKVAGTEGVNTLQMLCFDVDGLFLACENVTLSGQTFNDETPNTAPNDDRVTTGRGWLEGEVPAGTCAIHFVANRGIPTDHYSIGADENQIMLNDPYMSTAYSSAFTEPSGSKCLQTSNNSIIYWGYVRKANAGLMEEFLYPTKLENGVRVFDETRANTVELLRDRAKVTIDSYSKNNDGTHTIKKVRFLVTNGLARGYIAPSSYYGYTEMNFDGCRPYHHPEPNYPLRIQATASDFIEIGNNDIEEAQVNGVNTYHRNAFYLFDDDNDLSPTMNAAGTAIDHFNNPRIIVEVTYDDPQWGTKYFNIAFQDEKGRPYEIHRNHWYKVKLITLDPTHGFSFESFENAISSSNYANNALASIATIVNEVGTEYNKLVVDDGTAQVFDASMVNDSKNTNVTKVTVDGRTYIKVLIPFTCSTTDVRNHPLPTSSQLSVEWGTRALGMFADNTINIVNYTTSTSGNTAKGQGYVEVHLNESAMGNTPLKSDFTIYDQRYMLNRTVNIYSIASYKFENIDTPLKYEPSITKEFGERNGIAQHPPVYSLKFKLPDLDKDIYPLEIRFATTTLNAYAFQVNDGNPVEVNFGANISSTETLEESNSTDDWNYQAKKWNYWFSYTIPEKTDNATYTIYFNDVRPFRETKPDNVGLYLTCDHFEIKGFSCEGQDYTIQTSSRRRTNDKTEETTNFWSNYPLWSDFKYMKSELGF